jgi:lipopolysaccharide/colanic/teichoic acid biosynthesis glycosyltransferase
MLGETRGWAPMLFADWPSFRVLSQPMNDWGRIQKRVFDLLASTIILACIAAPMVAIWVLIRSESPGPGIFRQRRFGFGEQVIVVYKFRTMYAHRQDPSGERQTARGDDRVTRVGRILRRSSLDELPQLFNVLGGSMSLVGPRPHGISMKIGDQYYYDAVAQYGWRHRVKPGITGWAQVNGSRGEIRTMERARERVRYDLFYVNNWSFILDMLILFKTFGALMHDTAY